MPTPLSPPERPIRLPAAPRGVRLRRGIPGWVVWLLLSPFWAGVVAYDVYACDYIVALARAESGGTLVAGRIGEKSIYTRRQKRSGKTTTHYKLTFTYPVNDRTVSSDIDVLFDTYRHANVGDPLQVRVLPSWLDDHARVEQHGFQVIAKQQYAAEFLLLFANLILLVFLSKCNTHRARRALVMRGSETTGWILKKEGVGRRSWRLVYRYAVPAAKRGGSVVNYEANMYVSESEYAYAQIGETVTVLYDPRKPERSIIYDFSDYEVVGVQPQDADGNGQRGPHWTATSLAFADDPVDEHITTLPRGSRSKVVDSTPVKHEKGYWFGGAPEHSDRHQEFTRPDAKRMVLTLKRAYWFFVVLLVLAPIGAFLAGTQPALVAGFLFTLCVLAVIGIYNVVPRWTFCRETRTCVYESLWTRKEYALRQILAVQVCFGGVYHVIHRGGATTPYDTYQLNLVLDVAARTRVNLTHHPEREWTLDAGKQLADFLGVPLLIQFNENEP